MHRNLVTTTTTGFKYYVSYKVSLINNSAYAVNNIGVKFRLSTLSLPITNAAQVYTMSVISDTLNWVTVKGSFIADTNYTFITIGNHFNDFNTIASSIQPLIPGYYNAYYLIDDVCVSIDSLTCNLSLEVATIEVEKKIKIFPNQSAGKFTVLFVDNFVSGT